MTTPTTPRYRNDSWNLADEFGLAQAGDVVARITLDAEPPFSMGVVGKWGSGKTSVMRRAFATLKGKTLRQELALGEAAQETLDPLWNQMAFDNAKRKSALNWDEDICQLTGQCLPIWYSPWQHQNEDNPLIPLLCEIRAQFNVWLSVPSRVIPRTWERHSCRD